MQVENLLREWRASPERALTIALCDALADRGAVPAGTTDYEVVLHVGGYAGVRYGEDPEVLVAVGRMYLVAGEMRRALTPLAQAAKLSSSPAAFRLLGVLLLRMGQAKRAVQAFDRAIEGGIDDAETRAWHASAEAYKQVQEELGAEVVAERVAQGLETRQPLDGGGVASGVPGTVPGGFSAAAADAAAPMPPPRAMMSSVTEVMPSRMSAGDFVPPPFPMAEEDTATDTQDPRPAESSPPSPLPGDRDSPISSLPAQNMDSTLKAARPALSFGRDDDPSSMDDPTAVISVKRLLDSRYVQADAPARRIPDAEAGRRPQSSGVDFDLDRDGLGIEDLETNVYGAEDSATQSELVTGQVRIQAEAARAPEPTIAAPAAAPAAPAPEAGRVPAIASKTVAIAAEDRSDASHGTGAPLAKPVDAAAGTSRPAKRGGASMAVAAVVVLLIVGAGVGLRAGKLPWLAQHLPPWASQGANDSMPVQPEVTAAQGPATAAAGVEPVGAAASSGAPTAEVAPTTTAAAPTVSASIATPPTAAPSTAAPSSPTPPTTPVAQPPRRTTPRAPTATPTTTPKETPDAPIWLGDPELKNE